MIIQTAAVIARPSPFSIRALIMDLQSTTDVYRRGSYFDPGAEIPQAIAKSGKLSVRLYARCPVVRYPCQQTIESISL
jgi:hypothetical protein